MDIQVQLARSRARVDRFYTARALRRAARRPTARAVGLCLALAGLVIARPSAAQDVAQAEALFDRGLNEMQAGDYAAGCPKLAESYRLDPLPGALFTLAECEAAWGKVATAIEHYQSFVDGLTALPPARRRRFDERRRLALEKLAALSATAPELALEVSRAAPPNLVIHLNGEQVEPASYGVVRKVDPGEYHFSAVLDGEPQWERNVVLALSESVRVQVPWPLVERAPSVEPPRLAAPDGSPLRKWFYATGAVGVAGLAAGAVAGGLALAKKNVLDEHCTDRRCDARGHDAAGAAQRAALASTLGFAVGLAGAAAATTLFFLQRRADARADHARLRRGLRPAVLPLRAGVGLGLEGALP